MLDLPIGQLFCFGFEGTSLSHEAKLLLEKSNACGVTLFDRNIESLEQVVELNREITNTSTKECPNIISIDQEGGRVARLREICTNIPPLKTCGQKAHNDHNIIYRLAAMMACEIVALGFNLNFAPVVDIDSNLKNPIIGDRSFGWSAGLVANFGEYFIKSMQDAGLAACAKHFPGHGDTLEDSHLKLPVLNHDLAQLEKRELVPFKSAINANVASIMTAHIMLPKIDANYPATLSKKFLQQKLRNDLAFKGVIISDDLNMGAIADNYELKETIYLGLNAGVDLFLICQHEQKTLKAIEATKQLVAENKITKNRIWQSIHYIKTMKQKYLSEVEAPVFDQAKAIVRCQPHLDLVSTLA